MALLDSTEPLSKKQIFTFSCWPPDDGLEQQKNAEELPKHHMAPWSGTTVLRAGTRRRESCSVPQEAASGAAPSLFSQHRGFQAGFNACLLVPALWDGRGLSERLSPTLWTSGLLLRAGFEDRAGCPRSLPLEEATFSPLVPPQGRSVVQPLPFPRGQSELGEPVQLTKPSLAPKQLAFCCSPRWSSSGVHGRCTLPGWQMKPMDYGMRWSGWRHPHAHCVWML